MITAATHARNDLLHVRLRGNMFENRVKNFVPLQCINLRKAG